VHQQYQNTFFIPTDAHNYKITGMLKTIKIPTIASTCFGSRKNHHQGAISCLAKTTIMILLCSSSMTWSMSWRNTSLLCKRAVPYACTTKLWESLISVLSYGERVVQEKQRFCVRSLICTVDVISDCHPALLQHAADTSVKPCKSVISSMSKQTCRNQLCSHFCCPRKKTDL